MKPSAAILAAGDFPRKGGPAWNLLASAPHVVCCDSAIRSFRRAFHRWPDAVVGDLDSLGKTKVGCPVVHIAEQETNDLAKAIRFCRGKGWKRLVLVGATGKREDHTLGNLFRALDEQLEVVTDTGVFHPVSSKASFTAPIGTPVSIFAPHPKTQMTSRGLAWPLNGLAFSNLYCATLNCTTSSRFSVTTTHPVFVFVAQSLASPGKNMI